MKNIKILEFDLFWGNFLPLITFNFITMQSGKSMLWEAHFGTFKTSFSLIFCIYRFSALEVLGRVFNRSLSRRSLFVITAYNPGPKINLLWIAPDTAFRKTEFLPKTWFFKMWTELNHCNPYYKTAWSCI